MFLATVWVTRVGPGRSIIVGLVRAIVLPAGGVSPHQVIGIRRLHVVHPSPPADDPSRSCGSAIRECFVGLRSTLFISLVSRFIPAFVLPCFSEASFIAVEIWA